ncbi:MAG: hypothetical protein L0H93_00025 [Nocardioides sp.]|nr:hypothetical protein [Nocardioides sp.]
MTKPADAVRARQVLEAASAGPSHKLMTAADAVRRFVEDDFVVAVGGTNHARTPMALLWEILRQGRTGLSLSRPLTCYESELFIAHGAADRVITSWVGIGHGWGLAKVLREYVEQGRATYEEWSHLGLGLRYKAGAMGMPFLPTLSMMGSDLATTLGVRTTECPYTGQTLQAMPSLNPDVALIHVQRADIHGNAQIDGYELMDADVARAAQRLIISAEEIVPTESFRRDPSRTLIPGFAVDAVVEQPFGSYPHECYGRYDSDHEAFSDYVEEVRSGGSQGARSYVDSVLDAHPDFESYLGSIGEHRLKELRELAEGMMPK